MINTQVKSESSVAAHVISGFDQAHKQTQSIFATQKELIDSLQQMNEHWFARAKSEAELAGALASRLASARSMPDATSMCQDWFGQRLQRCVEDSTHVLMDVQKFIQTGVRLANNGHEAAAE